MAPRLKFVMFLGRTTAGCEIISLACVQPNVRAGAPLVDEFEPFDSRLKIFGGNRTGIWPVVRMLSAEYRCHPTAAIASSNQKPK